MKNYADLRGRQSFAAKKRENFKSRRSHFTADGRLQIKRQTFADGKAAKTTLVGYPILWGELSSDRGGYKVRLTKNSATFTSPALALYNHDFADVIGNTANGTLRILAADDTGVPVEIDLPDTSLGNDLAVLVAEKYISGMSFSMMNGFEDYTEEKQGDQYIVNVSKFTVDEVTVTPIPAFSATTIDVADPDDDAVPSVQATLPIPGGMSRLASARRNLRSENLHANFSDCGLHTGSKAA